MFPPQQPSRPARPPGRMADGTPIHVPAFSTDPNALGADKHAEIMCSVVNGEPLPNTATPAEQALYREMLAEYQEASKHPRFEAAVPHEGRGR